MDRLRYLESSVREDLAEKMVFIAGPRQVGKTTLARRILASSESGAYLNWDNRGDRAEIRAARLGTDYRDLTMYDYQVKLVRVIDADTVVVDIDLGCPRRRARQRVRR